MRAPTTRLVLIALAVASLALTTLDPAVLLDDQRSHLHKLDAVDSVLAARFAQGAGAVVNGLDGVVTSEPCVAGSAGPFACAGVDLLSFVPLDSFAARGGDELSDIWGWVDPETGDEYALVGMTSGIVVFRITDPTAPELLGQVRNLGTTHRIWHDIKVHADHAFIVTESTDTGMTVLDLTTLRGLDADPDRRIPTQATYRPDLDAHNIVINTEAELAFMVGSAGGVLGRPTPAGEECLSGLHAIDISDPTNPAFAGCHVLDSYVHDAQCVRYAGPDEAHTGKDICFGANEETISAVDVSDPALPRTLGLTTYPFFAYVHQGWLTADHSFFLLGDELDEQRFGGPTKTLIFDVRDLENPTLIGTHEGPTEAIDHNMYERDGLLYQSNYEAGLRILDLDGVADAQLEEIAYFDTYPESDAPEFNGTWSNYPYYPSGTVAVTGIGEGLFLLRVHDAVLAEHAG